MACDVYRPAAIDQLGLSDLKRCSRLRDRAEVEDWQAGLDNAIKDGKDPSSSTRLVVCRSMNRLEIKELKGIDLMKSS